MNMCMGMCVCVSSGRGEKRVLGPWELEFQAVLSYSMWFWDLNPSPLKEQWVLLT